MNENQETENQKNKKEYEWFFIAGCVIFLSVFFCDIFFLAKKIHLHPNADLSSEMILAKLLRDEHKWITSNWFYSTELRVIAIAPIYSLFFYVSDKWDTTRVLGSILMYILFSVGIYYFCSRLIKDGRRIAPICCAIMLLPFSFEWQNMLLTGMYYTPQVAASFAQTALLLDIIATPSEKKAKRIMLLSFSLLIAILSGLGGPRMMVMQYIPLFLCGLCLIRKHFLFFLGTVFDLISVGIGYVINHILKASGAYVYSTYSHVRPSFLSLISIRNLLLDLFRNFGAKAQFKDYQGIFGCIFAGLVWCGFVFATVLMIVNAAKRIRKQKSDVVSEIKKAEKAATSDDEPIGLKIVILYAVFQLIIFLMLYLFTNMDYQARYNIHILAFIIPIVCAIVGRKWRYGLLIVTFIALVLCVGNYASYSKPDNNYAIYSAIAEYLKGSDINEGYASFWNANILTEMNDGKTEVWILESDSNRRSMTSADTIFPNDGKDVVPAQWLQKRSHENSSPEKPYFVIVTNEEYDRYIQNKSMYDEHFVMVQGNLRLYVFDEDNR